MTSGKTKAQVEAMAQALREGRKVLFLCHPEYVMRGDTKALIDQCGLTVRRMREVDKGASYIVVEPPITPLTPSLELPPLDPDIRWTLRSSKR